MNVTNWKKNMYQDIIILMISIAIMRRSRMVIPFFRYSPHIDIGKLISNTYWGNSQLPDSGRYNYCNSVLNIYNIYTRIVHT